MRSSHRAPCVISMIAACALSTAAHGQSTSALERIRQAASAEIAAGNMPGLAVAVVHEGRVVLAEGFGIANIETRAAVTPETVFQAGSAGKMLTAAAVLEASANGAIGLHDPIGRAASGLAPAIAARRPHQLLAHIAGLRDVPGAHAELGDAHMAGSFER